MRALVPGALCVLVLALVMAPQIRRLSQYAFEDAMLFARPSGNLAFEYATRHFGQSSGDNYDVERARALYLRALSLDPQHPLVYHQLSRIAFVHGSIHDALALIDRQIELHPDATDGSSFYVRGLIYGFMGEYARARADYETFLAMHADRWPAYNDYAWILLRQHENALALDAVEKGLALDAANPWLLNSKATALYELGRYVEALAAARAAKESAVSVTEAEWIKVNPGNDPSMAETGLVKLRGAIDGNIAKIEKTIASSSVR